MAILPDFPVGLHDPKDVTIFNQELKSIWFQERALLNHPLADFREYIFEDGPALGVQVQKTLVTEILAVPCSVPDLDDEVIVNSGGLILPTDRFLSIYDEQPNILSVVEWPSASGNLFTIKRKEYNPASGRCEMLIRQDNHLTGIVYKHVTGQSFGGSNWLVGETTADIVVTTNRNDLDYEEQLIFAGIASVGDIVFWALKTAFRTDPLNPATQFIPAARDIIVDKDILGNDATYRVVGHRLDPDDDFYRILARRFEES